MKSFKVKIHLSQRLRKQFKPHSKILHNRKSSILNAARLRLISQLIVLHAERCYVGVCDSVDIKTSFVSSFLSLPFHHDDEEQGFVTREVLEILNFKEVKYRSWTLVKMSSSTVTSEIWQDQFLEAISTDLFEETLAERNENDNSPTKCKDDKSSNSKLKKTNNH